MNYKKLFISIIILVVGYFSLLFIVNALEKEHKPVKTKINTLQHYEYLLKKQKQTNLILEKNIDSLSTILINGYAEEKQLELLIKAKKNKFLKKVDK